jgi:hypothetical protein
MSLPVPLPPCKGVPMAMEVAPPAKGMEVATPAKGGVCTPMDLDIPEEEFDKKGGDLLGTGIKVGKDKVKEMVMGGGPGWEVVGICGMGGSGKTTLAMEIYKDQKVQGNNKSHNHLVSYQFFLKFFLFLRCYKVYHSILELTMLLKFSREIFGKSLELDWGIFY